MGAVKIVVDLRDLCAVDARVVTLIEQLHTDCEAKATTLRLLVCEHTHHDTIAGLCDSARRHGEPRAVDRARPRPVGTPPRSRRVRPA
jgi:hypothetical protein